MEAFARDMRERFIQRIALHLRNNFRQAVAEYTDRELIGMVGRGVLKARTYRITLQADVVRFVEYLFLYHPEFDERPAWKWAESILRSDQLTGTEKMDKIDAADQFLR
jgi:hypothetical protein